MTLNEVVQAGEFNFLEKVGLAFQSVDDASLRGVAILFILISVMLFFIARKEQPLGKLTWIYVSTISLFLFFIIASQTLYTNSDKVNLWKQEYVIPYVETLPTEKFTLEHYGPISEKSFNKEGYTSSEFFLKNDSSIDPVVVNITYRLSNKTSVEQNVSVLVRYDLQNGEKPYLEMKNIETDLGNKVNAGYVNPIIHLPEQHKTNH